MYVSVFGFGLYSVPIDFSDFLIHERLTAGERESLGAFTMNIYKL